MTNYEKIKAMSLEQLARLLRDVSRGDAVMNTVCRAECKVGTVDERPDCPHLAEADAYNNLPCHKCVEKWWLRAEVSDENEA